MAASRGEFAAFPTNHVTMIGVVHPAGQHDYKRTVPSPVCVPDYDHVGSESSNTRRACHAFTQCLVPAMYKDSHP